MSKASLSDLEKAICLFAIRTVKTGHLYKRGGVKNVLQH